MHTEPWVARGDAPIGDNNAASYVDWNDATAFCERLTDTDHENGKLPAGESYRLPTEAEWEYACRADTHTWFSFGNDQTQLGDYAWFKGNTRAAGEAYAHAVGMKKPNPMGLHDMHGNVYEWCSDCYDRLLGRIAPVGPEGCKYRVLRGGSWENEPLKCRSAYRDFDIASRRRNGLGFRVVRQ